jgi:hypothetical protein
MQIHFGIGFSPFILKHTSPWNLRFKPAYFFFRMFRQYTVPSALSSIVLCTD